MLNKLIVWTIGDPNEVILAKRRWNKSISHFIGLAPTLRRIMREETTMYNEDFKKIVEAD